jgi:hypothetical protein
MRFDTEDLLKRELAALPELTPPPEAEARVLAAMRRAAAEPRALRWKGPTFAALALAATAAFAAVLVFWQARNAPGEGPHVATNSAFAPLPLEDYAALVAQSAALERALTRLPAPRAVMRASTAGTIANLEDRIAQIDQELTLATAAGVDSKQRAALWQDRVEVMNALVQVRYANSQVFIY